MPARPASQPRLLRPRHLEPPLHAPEQPGHAPESGGGDDGNHVHMFDYSIGGWGVGGEHLQLGVPIFHFGVDSDLDIVAAQSRMLIVDSRFSAVSTPILMILHELESY